MARTRVETEILRLNLRYTWTTAMSSSDHRDTLIVRIKREGITGVGEGAPIVRYGEDAAGGAAAIEKVRTLIERSSPMEFTALMREVRKRLNGNHAAQAALAGALMDWVGKKLGVPLYRLFGLDPTATPLTTFSIGIDDPETTRQKVEEAAPYPVLKIKVGLDSDEATLAAVRSATDKPLRVDANEGWKDKETAVRKIEWLSKQGKIEMIEQPMPAAMIDETAWVRERVNIPIVADEACIDLASIPRLAGAYDGINVKLDKCGGVLEARTMLETARALGMKTMLGCMVSSSVAITTAAHLSPLADWADLDGHLLVANDPWRGVLVAEGRLILPDRPGLGLEGDGTSFEAEPEPEPEGEGSAEGEEVSEETES